MESMYKIVPEEPLGRGAFGLVYKGQFQENDVAIKKVQLPFAENDRELNSLRILNHPNVVKLLYSEQDADFR